MQDLSPEYRNYSEDDKAMTAAQDVGHLAGGGFAGHLAGSHDALDGPIQSRDDIDQAA